MSTGEVSMYPWLTKELSHLNKNVNLNDKLMNPSVSVLLRVGTYLTIYRNIIAIKHRLHLENTGLVVT